MDGLRIPQHVYRPYGDLSGPLQTQLDSDPVDAYDEQDGMLVICVKVGGFGVWHGTGNQQQVRVAGRR
jgi:hypothetical protein